MELNIGNDRLGGKVYLIMIRICGGRYCLQCKISNVIAQAKEVLDIRVRADLACVGKFTRLIIIAQGTVTLEFSNILIRDAVIEYNVTINPVVICIIAYIMRNCVGLARTGGQSKTGPQQGNDNKGAELFEQHKNTFR
jgi:hypothetical protein